MALTTEEIIEGNKAISEFMGSKVTAADDVDAEGWGTYTLEMWHPEGDIIKSWYTSADNDILSKNCALRSHFYTSWDWLMPVIEKISTIQYTDESWNGCEPYHNYAWPRTFGMRDIEGNYMVRLNANQLHTAPNLIEAAWMAVVGFITSHNEQSK